MLRKIITVLTIIMASPVATQELQSIELKDGANAYQSKAIASAMSDKILKAFKYASIASCWYEPAFSWHVKAHCAV